MKSELPKAGGHPVARSRATPFIQIESVTKKFGDFVAVDDVEAQYLQGRTVRAARRLGLRQDHAAQHARRLRNADQRAASYIDGQDMTGIPPYERPVNMMFQSYALFPHMTVEQNVGYGLKHEK